MDNSDLLLSHDELRAVILLAGMELRKRSIGWRDSPLLQLMRRGVLEACVFEKAHGECDQTR